MHITPHQRHQLRQLERSVKRTHAGVSSCVPAHYAPRSGELNQTELLHSFVLSQLAPSVSGRDKIRKEDSVKTRVPLVTRTALGRAH